MEQISPTRMTLLQKRSQLQLASKGVDLLKKKRDALVGEFFALVHETLEARKKLEAAAKDAYFALFLAKAFDGPEVVDALALGMPVLDDVTADVENVWGTKVPKLIAKWPEGAAASPIATGGQTLKAQEAFRRFAQALVEVANTETRLRRIGEEIKKTTRRVNALEQVVIPGVLHQMRFIKLVLEQREREDTFRLKRIKAGSEKEEKQPATA
ncbi:V-type ATP synthase subunit D [Oceanithermus sp.]